MLYVHFIVLIARECQVYFMQHTCFNKCLDLGLVKEVGKEMSLTKEQPVAAISTGCITFSKEGTKRRNTCTRTDHDHISRRGGRHFKILFPMNVERQLRTCGLVAQEFTA